MIGYERLALLLAFQAPIIDLLFSAYAFFTFKNYTTSRSELRLLRLLAITGIGVMLNEVMGYGAIYEVFLLKREMAPLFNTFTYIFLIFNAMLWTEFCLQRIKGRKGLFPLMLRVQYALVGVTILARIALRNTKLYVYMEDGELKYGPLDDIQTYLVVLIYLQLLILLIHKFRDRKEFVNHEKIRKMLAATAILFLVIGVNAFLFIPYLSWMAHMIVLLYNYGALQSTAINNDELTGLNNRRNLIKRVHFLMREENEWTYLIADANNFKRINDEFGHTEGDNALVIIADALRTIASKNDAGAYRYGGDEFVLLLKTGEKEMVEKICDDIDECIARYAKKLNVPYELSLSCGYTVYNPEKHKTIPDLMEEADNNMYEMKKKKKSARA